MSGRSGWQRRSGPAAASCTSTSRMWAPRPLALMHPQPPTHHSPLRPSPRSPAARALRLPQIAPLMHPLLVSCPCLSVHPPPPPPFCRRGLQEMARRALRYLESVRFSFKLVLLMALPGLLGLGTCIAGCVRGCQWTIPVVWPIPQVQCWLRTRPKRTPEDELEHGRAGKMGYAVVPCMCQPLCSKHNNGFVQCSFIMVELTQCMSRHWSAGKPVRSAETLFQ